jgi:hypothetical protein
VSLPHSVLFEQPIRPLHGAQGALGVLGHAGQHPLALRSLAPAAVGLLGRPCVVELEPVVEAAGGVRIRALDGVDQLLDARAHEPHGVLGGGGAQHRSRVDDLLGRGVEQPQLLRQRERRLERQTLLAVQEQAGTEAGQRARVPAAVVDRQADCDLPAQIPGHGLHRLLVGEPGAVLQEQQLGQLRGRDRGAADALRIAVGEVLVAHDPLAVLGQQGEERTLRRRPNQLCRIEETNLSRGRREHARNDPRQPGRDEGFSAVS